jgi:BirA family transcriptional regulator, biotin operon repressor / biotin---[acetyl-CoA-carboxylase] ligase
MKEIGFKMKFDDLPLAEVRYYGSIGSTNDIALEWAQAGARDLSLVVADEQTAGRGRLNRRWLTPRHSALAFSLIIRPDSRSMQTPGLFSPLGALSVALALEEFLMLTPQIKWPNDVLLNGQKTAGILAEAVWEDLSLRAIVLGIGVNVASDSIPPPAEVLFPATCIEAAAGRRVDRYQLLENILSALVLWRERLGLPEFMAEWQKRLAYRGQVVTINQVGQPARHGRIMGVGYDGSLVLQNGTEEFHVLAGDVSIRLSAS